MRIVVYKEMGVFVLDEIVWDGNKRGIRWVLI